MKYRRELDIRRFAQAAGEQSSLIQLITAMQEIKLKQLREAKTLAMETYPSETVQNQCKRIGTGTSTTSWLSFF